MQTLDANRAIGQSSRQSALAADRLPVTSLSPSASFRNVAACATPNHPRSALGLLAGVPRDFVLSPGVTPYHRYCRFLGDAAVARRAIRREHNQPCPQSRPRTRLSLQSCGLPRLRRHDAGEPLGKDLLIALSVPAPKAARLQMSLHVSPCHGKSRMRRT